ncbi:MAG: adenylate/guanylate cyclase domain-containing protein [Nevskia sp.]|nr:adenylate/guanylate cyclase domain-containing protein [Nevskia sp.]
MISRINTCGVLFADIAGNTALRQRLGDAEAGRGIRSLIGTMSAAVAGYGGRVIKSDGDDILAVFENQPAIDSANAAIAIQLLAQEAGLALYVGLHVGPVEFCEVLGRPDVLGQTVNFAARLHKLVPDAPGYIFIARELLHDLTPELAARTEPFGVRAIKGIGEVAVCTLQWREAQTVMPTKFAGAGAVSAPVLGLVIRHGETSRRLAGSAPPVLIGRAKDAFLRLDDPELKISSGHLKLEPRAGLWFAQDKSRNGTWLKDAAGGEELHLLGVELALPRTGALCLGRRFAEDPAQSFTLQFEIVMA